MAKSHTIILLIFILLSSCATYKPQYKHPKITIENNENRNLIKTFYLFGDGGYIDNDQTTAALIAFEAYTKNKGAKDKIALFLGDNIYPNGMPEVNHPRRKNAEYTLQKQFETVKNKTEQLIFMPGNHDWYSDGFAGLMRQEDFVNKLERSSFVPSSGCPIESISISDEIQLLVIDTQWYLEDWDKHPTINRNCAIQTRDKFFDEIAGELKKNSQKTILFAMHHPMFTNGIHGGKHPVKKHLFPFQNKLPLPVLSSMILQLRTPGGIISQDRASARYNGLMQRIKILTKVTERLVFISGHEHNLQYIEEEGFKQIVSGSASKVSEAALGNNGLFSYGGHGFAILELFDDGGSQVKYIGLIDAQPVVLFETEVHTPQTAKRIANWPEQFPKTRQAAVYDSTRTEKSAFFETVWGKRYREIYSTKVTAPVALLDTLYGGLSPVRPGGGNQTKSLRLVDKDGKNYNMRALEKNALQFLQKSIMKDTDVGKDFQNTFAEDLIYDFYTAAHPYGAFVIPTLSDAVDVLHTNPKLYYVPKQKALGKYNDDYGDALYMIVERPHNAYKKQELFDGADKIRSTEDLFNQLHGNEKNRLDEGAFIRARLFDMLIGDWDRHADQWRWAEFQDQDGKDIFLPIPRDRDQVFANFDGAFLDVIRALMGISRQLHVYDGTLDKKDIQWFNLAGSRLDRALIQNATKEEWIRQAAYIQEQLTDEVIENAFKNIPKAVQNELSEDIKQKLRTRRGNLVTIAEDYYQWFSKLQIVTATNKDDFIDIERFEDGSTRIKVFRNKKGERADLLLDRTYYRNETKEIWVYGLDDTDVFTVTGNARKPILIRLIGGHGKDTYDIRQGKRIKIYDWKSLPDTIVNNRGASITFRDDYDNNTYDLNKLRINQTTVFPKVGYNPDDGVLIGLSASLTKHGFKRNPYTQQHKLNGGFYFATNGFDLKYDGTFAKVLGKWNLGVGAYFTSPNFAQNFFGYGNETVNNDSDFGMDYNRVRISQIRGEASLNYNNAFGATYFIKTALASIEIENSPERFIATTSEDIELRKNFAFLEAGFKYENYNNKLNPSQGMLFDVQAGLTTHIAATENTFGHLNASLAFFNPISANKKLVLHTKAATQLRFGDTFELYQAAILGGNTGLRAYRNERLTGKSSFVTGADLRYAFNSFRTGFIPLQIGLLGGYDGGRVWMPNEDSNVWHNSYGGGFWVSGAESITGTFYLFHGNEGLRFSFMLSIGL